MTAPERAHGPYETEAAALADLEALTQAGELTETGAGRVRLLMLRAVLEQLGVEAAAFDLFILARFGHWEPDAVMVVRGLVERAYAAGAAASSPTAASAGRGPYDTEAQARTDAAALLAAIHTADPGIGLMTDEIRAARLQARVDYLTGALADAGVQLGDYDRRIAAWLADWETETLQVLVGWIERAHG